MHFNWLHFTDLHCGMTEDRWLWDTVLERLRKDLWEHRVLPQQGTNPGLVGRRVPRPPGGADHR